MTFGTLLGSEIRRLAARRVVRWGVAVVLVIVAAVVVVATIRSTGTGPTDHTMLLRRLWLERRGDVEESSVLAVSTYVFILVVGIAATAVGGDYRAGTMGALLTWEPRRMRVVLARIGAIKIVTIALYLVVIGVFVGGWTLGAALRGSTAGLGPDFWINLVAVIGRSVIVVAVLGVVTAGLAFITRNTVGAVIIWFGYLIGVEAVLGQRIRELQPGLILANLVAFLRGSDAETFRKETFDATGLLRAEVLVARPGPGLIRLLVIATVVGGLGVLAFRRRDVI